MRPNGALKTSALQYINKKHRDISEIGCVAHVAPASLLVFGIVVALYILQFSLLSSILIGSIFASHTLILYPVVSKLGIAKNRAVNVAIGGTIITDTLALLVLAVVVELSGGELTGVFWIRLIIGVTLFSLIVLLLFPVVARWFFKRFEDSVQQYLFVLALVFFGAGPQFLF